MDRKPRFFAKKIESVDVKGLLQVLAHNETNFAPSKKRSGFKRSVDLQIRRSLSLERMELVSSFIKEIRAQVRVHWSEIIKELKIPDFCTLAKEQYCLAYQNENFLTQHVDFSPCDLLPRRVTWIFYAFKSPKPFSGGDLRLFYGENESLSISPESGLLIVFDSLTRHSADTTYISSDRFDDSRFVITGFEKSMPTAYSLPKYLLSQLDRIESSMISHGVRRFARKVRYLGKGKI